MSLVQGDPLYFHWSLLLTCTVIHNLKSHVETMCIFFFRLKVVYRHFLISVAPISTFFDVTSFMILSMILSLKWAPHIIAIYILGFMYISLNLKNGLLPNFCLLFFQNFCIPLNFRLQVYFRLPLKFGLHLNFRLQLNLCLQNIYLWIYIPKPNLTKPNLT